MSGFYNGISIRGSDGLFSKYVRIRDRKCVFGVKCYPVERRTENGDLDISYLQCCHYHSRRKESVRIDPENADAGCPACHEYLDSTAEGKQFHHSFKRKQLGENAHNLLQLRAETTSKKDEPLARMYAKQLLKEVVAA